MNLVKRTHQNKNKNKGMKDRKELQGIEVLCKFSLDIFYDLKCEVEKSKHATNNKVKRRKPF